MDKIPLLSARGLSREYSLGRGKTLHALNGVDLDIYPGETLGIVGESGCGKSTLGRCMIALLKPSAGSVTLEGREISCLDERQLFHYRPHMQMIFQDPYASLDPRMTAAEIIAEPIVTHRPRPGREELRRQVLELMEEVGLPGEYSGRYPHQFSGGQRQRLGIARAIALRPKLVVCDEPVSALDVSVQNQILDLLVSLRQRHGLSYLFISHDLSVVRYLSGRVCVMYLGRVCELGETEQIYSHALHPYTRCLLSSVPKPDPSLRELQPEPLKGEPPSPLDLPTGCPFHSRCPHAREICAMIRPELRQVQARQVACHFAGEI